MAALCSRAGHYILFCFFFFLLLSFFLAYSQPSQIGCLPYFHTWCGLSANLGHRSETCCTRLAEGRKNAKNRHLGTIVQLCRAVSSQLRHIPTIGKSLLNSDIFSTCPHNMANFISLTAEIDLPLGTPANFNGFRVLPSLLQRRRSPEANQTFHDNWPSPRLVHYVGLYIFRGSWRLTEFLPRPKFTVRASLEFCYTSNVTTRHSSSGRQPNFARRGTRNGIMELSQTAPPIFGWAAITLGIGQHSTN